MNDSDAFVFIHFLAARVLDIVAEDDLVSLRVLRTCTRRKAAIKQAPERWKRACIKSNLLINYSSATAATTTTTLSGVAGSDAGVAHRRNAGRMAAAEGRRSMGVVICVAVETVSCHATHEHIVVASATKMMVWRHA